MKRVVLLIATFVILFFSLTQLTQAASVITILKSLRSQNLTVVENICRSLGLERGALGLSKVQGLYPNCASCARSLFIIALSWEGPKDGYLVLIDSTGNILEKKRLGYIKNLNLRPLGNKGNDNVVVDFIKGTGTGVRQDLFCIFSVHTGGFDVIWQGLSYEKSFPGTVSQPDNYEIQGFLTFSDLNKDNIDELMYTQKRTDYVFDQQNQEFLVLKEVVTKQVYRLKNGKYRRDSSLDHKFSDLN